MEPRIDLSAYAGRDLTVDELAAIGKKATKKPGKVLISTKHLLDHKKNDEYVKIGKKQIKIINESRIKSVAAEKHLSPSLIEGKLQLENHLYTNDEILFIAVNEQEIKNIVIGMPNAIELFDIVKFSDLPDAAKPLTEEGKEVATALTGLYKELKPATKKEKEILDICIDQLFPKGSTTINGFIEKKEEIKKLRSEYTSLLAKAINNDEVIEKYIRSAITRPDHSINREMARAFLHSSPEAQLHAILPAFLKEAREIDEGLARVYIENIFKKNPETSLQHAIGILEVLNDEFKMDKKGFKEIHDKIFIEGNGDVTQFTIELAVHRNHLPSVPQEKEEVPIAQPEPVSEPIPLVEKSVDTISKLIDSLLKKTDAITVDGSNKENIDRLKGLLTKVKENELLKKELNQLLATGLSDESKEIQKLTKILNGLVTYQESGQINEDLKKLKTTLNSWWGKSMLAASEKLRGTVQGRLDTIQGRDELKKFIMNNFSDIVSSIKYVRDYASK
ncbi:MAG: hypothetical protein JSR46_04840 [Verrucomicrobia bacterium]|nr:hypothetical protein [Verrucomicrobiota bacterium]